MPASAIAARVVDFVLPPEEIAQELARLSEVPLAARHEPCPRRRRGRCPRRGPRAAAGASASISPPTSSRPSDGASRGACSCAGSATSRVRRPDDDDPGEVEALYRDILIMVTEFFREPETFDVLRERVFPPSSGTRAATPACASGSGLLHRRGGLQPGHHPARRRWAHGLRCPSRSSPRTSTSPTSRPLGSASTRKTAPRRHARAVAPLLRARAEGYQINKAVRELCVFARHT